MGRNSNQHICCLNGLSLMNAQKISKSTFNLYVQYMANPEKKKKKKPPFAGQNYNNQVGFLRIK